MLQPKKRIGDGSMALAASPKASAGSTAARRWRAFRANWVALLGGLVVLLFLGCALGADLIAFYPPLKLDPGNRLQPPSAAHWLGTDEFGRDEASRIIYGARVSMAVGLIVVGLCSVIGITLGLLAGYYRRADAVVMRVLDGLMAFPGILLAIAIAAALRPSVSTVIVALTFVEVPRFARVMRAPVLAAKEAVFVDAARVIGCTDLRILTRHLLPNTISPLIVQATFTFAQVILTEASLSFLGAGVPPPTPSWGGMLSDARTVMRDASWLTLVPAVVVASVTMAFNLFGDGLRDALDPRHLA
jgi:peptide/nickel transport system permease protein